MSEVTSSGALLLSLVLLLSTAPAIQAVRASPITEGGWPEIAAGTCPPLPAPSGLIVHISNEAELRQWAYQAAPGSTVLIAACSYDMGSYVHVIHNDIALRGATART